MKKIVLFASGNGSNVENIIQYFKNNDTISVVGIFTNNPHAKVVERAKNHEIASFIFDKNQLYEGQVLEEINKLQPDLIVLAGFLLKFPEHIIAHYPNKIINIHPALLPNYGGKGMYGMNVHRSVLENKEKETGITIHYVNENYDEGAIIFQQSIILTGEETPEVVATKIHELEYKYFPEVIEKLMKE